MTTELFNEAKAAAALGVKPATLRRWRWCGGSLPFLKVGGAVRYAAADISAWLETRRRTSTTEEVRHG